MVTVTPSGTNRSSSLESPNSTSLTSSPMPGHDWTPSLELELQPPVVPQLGQSDLTLLHHYTSSTVSTMSDAIHVIEVWGEAVPRLAVANNFLMHAVLGVAAAHLAHLCPAENGFYQKRASMLRNQALRSALPSFNKITTDNCDALFAFACMAAFSMFALPASSDAGVALSPLDDILEYFPLVRGIGSLLRNGNMRAWIKKGDLQTLLEPRGNLFKQERSRLCINRMRKTDTLPGRWPVTGQPTALFLPTNLKAQLDGLEALNEQFCRDSERPHYRTTIEHLKTVFGTLKLNPDTRNTVFVWGALVPDGYLIALRARRPMALVILAYYGLMVHRVNSRWWCAGRGAALIGAIHQELPPLWKSAIEWPVKVIQGTAC